MIPTWFLLAAQNPGGGGGIDPGKLVGLIVAILFVLLPTIAQLWAKKKQGQPPAQRPPGPPQGQPRRQPQQPQPQARPAQVDNEIEDFLRRAAGRRGRQAAGQQGGAPPPARPAAQPPMAQRQPVVELVEPEVLEEGPLGSDVSRHVGEYLDTQEIESSTRQLGSQLAETDERAESRVHETFDHQVSRFDSVLGESAKAPSVEQASEAEDRDEGVSVAAAGLPAMLNNAAGLRQAIILNEILQRPEDRWA